MKFLLKMFLGFFLLAIIIKAEEGIKYGKEIELKETTKISQILKKPADFVSKKVLVEGTILNVCPNMGCWIELKSDVENEKIRVKVTDGEIVFPVESKGKTALVEGEVYAIEIEAEHDSENEEGEHSCETGEHTKEVKTIYQIKGLGAVIK